MAVDLNKAVEELQKSVERLCGQTSPNISQMSSMGMSSFSTGLLGGYQAISAQELAARNAQLQQWYNQVSQQYNRMAGQYAQAMAAPAPPPKNEVAETLQWAEEKYKYDDEISALKMKMNHYIKENDILKRRIERIKRPWILNRIKKLLS